MPLLCYKEHERLALTLWLCKKMQNKQNKEMNKQNSDERSEYNNVAK